MHLMKRNFVESDQGILVSRSPEIILPKTDRAELLGIHTINVIRDGKELGWVRNYNKVVNVGLNYLLNSAAPIAETAIARATDWFIWPFKTAYTPQATDTMADLASYGELTEYDEAARVEWVVNGASTAQLLSNSTAPATFTINATVTCNGAGIGTVSTKSSATGTMLCAANYSPARALVSGDVVLIQYDLAMTSA